MFLHNSVRLRPVVVAICATCLLLGSLCQAAAPEEEAQAAGEGRDRSPVDLVLGPGEDWLVTANQTSDSISLVSLDSGRVLDELPVGRRPTAIAICPDGRRVLVSCRDTGDLHLVAVEDSRLQPLRRIHVGFLPHGVAVAPSGDRAYAACTATAEVAVVDLQAGEVTARIGVGRWPRSLALSPDGSRLAVGASGERGISIIDTQRQAVLHVDRSVQLNIGQLQVSADGRSVYFPWMVYRRNPITANNIRQGWVLASRLGRVSLDSPPGRENLALDPSGQAVADPHGLALTPDERRVVIAASGTQELLVFGREGLPWTEHAGTDHIDSRLLRDAGRFFRVPLGGRPMAVRASQDNRRIFVANYLDNSVQVVDLDQRQVARTISLGGPAQPSLARRGEAIFFDGRRSLDQWYSCHSCHYEGGTNAVTTDTLNDGSPMTFKTVLPLYGLEETGPWTWHGWQTDVRDALENSLTSTMLGPAPSDEDVDALAAYLRTRQPPPNPFRTADGSLTAAARRGREIFQSERAGCASCHTGPWFTDDQVHDVGTGRVTDRYEGYNPPSLRGVYEKLLLLHDGRCGSLEELLTGPHNPAHVAGSGELSEQELQDLIAYLRSL